MENIYGNSEDLLIKKVKKDRRFLRIIGSIMIFILGTILWMLISSPLSWSLFIGLFFISLYVAFGKISLTDDEVRSIKTITDQNNSSSSIVKKEDHNLRLLKYSGFFFLLGIAVPIMGSSLGFGSSDFQAPWFYFLVSNYISYSNFISFTSLFFIVIALVTFITAGYRIMHTKVPPSESQ